MIRDQIMRIAQSDPRYERAIDAIEAQIGNMDVSPDEIQEIIKTLEYLVQNPESYPQVRQEVINRGLVDPGMLPNRYDQVFIISVLIAMYGLEDRLNTKAFARGGLVGLADYGRGGDTELAHVNPREAEMLRRMGGSGTINPHTGLREYKGGGLGGILKVALPIAAAVFIPGAGAAIGGALGASGTAASILGGAVLGGGMSALGGGNVLKGAALGALGGGFGDSVGGAANNAMGLNLGATGQSILGNALVGAGTSALTGENALKGAATGALATGLGSALGSTGATGALGKGLSSAGKTFGNMVSAGMPVKEAVLGGGLAGLAQGLYAPKSTTGGPLNASDIQSDQYSALNATNGMDMQSDQYQYQPTNYQANMPTVNDLNLANGSDLQSDQYQYKPNGQVLATPQTSPSVLASQQAPADSGFGFNLKTIGTGLLAAGALGGSKIPPQAQQQIQSLQQSNPQMYEYLNRPSTTWDWSKISTDATQAGLPLDQYVASNWNRLTAGQYNYPVKAARGGLMQGYLAGGGRSDNIKANLSPDEYVMDAETVAMLGDGSPKEGARRLDEMRKEIRKHKGKALANGKFSPNAKSPLSYLKEHA
jgi:hypothetical protein